MKVFCLISKDECEALIEAADADGDGNINYEEFGDMLFERTKSVYKCHQRSAMKSRLRKKSVKKQVSLESQNAHIVSQEPATLGLPNILTSYISVLCLIFITACLIFLYI